MCTNHECARAPLCYRHEAKPSDFWQSYMSGKECEHNEYEMFWEIKDRQWFGLK